MLQPIPVQVKRSFKETSWLGKLTEGQQAACENDVIPVPDANLSRDHRGLTRKRKPFLHICGMPGLKWRWLWRGKHGRRVSLPMESAGHNQVKQLTFHTKA